MLHEIPLSSPDITDAEILAVEKVMRSGRLSIGSHLEAFEAACAERSGRRYSIGVNSGTSGLHLCVKTLGIGPGDEVITTPFSFIATTNCVLFEGATPVFVDIDPTHYNLDYKAIEAAITPKTKAILPVEVFGNTADFDKIEEIAKKHNLFLIEDSCEALGGNLNGRPAGNFGEFGVFAFYPNKQITTGEGGMIVTDNKLYRDMCRSLRNQGRSTTAWLSHSRLGYNYRLSEISAVVGEVQMTRLDEILEKRRQVAGMYNTVLADISELSLPPMFEPEHASWFVYVVRLADKFQKSQRDQLITYLRGQGVGCSNYFVPIHTQPYIQKLMGTQNGDYPVTERIAERTIALPFFSDLGEEQIFRIKKELIRGIGRLE